MSDRTTGRVFEAPDGKTYRPSMFLTLTLPSYGRVTGDGVPLDPRSYDYRRAALDAMHFPKLVDRFWQNLRRCSGYSAQYFATVEPQRRLAPHLHAAIRGAIPRKLLEQVVAATYHQVWWPQLAEPIYSDADELPVWDDSPRFTPTRTRVRSCRRGMRRWTPSTTTRPRCRPTSSAPGARSTFRASSPGPRRPIGSSAT